jgi:hypothetical protein
MHRGTVQVAERSVDGGERTPRTIRRSWPAARTSFVSSDPAARQDVSGGNGPDPVSDVLQAIDPDPALYPISTEAAR